MVQASQNRIGTLTDQAILYCFHYDPKTGKYSMIVSRVIQIAGGLTILTLGTVLLVLFRRGPDSELRGHSRSHQYVR